jgi:cytochrome c-type biogenesis protein CcmF
MVVHLGVILIGVAFAASAAYGAKAELRMAPGETVHALGHTFTYEGRRVVRHVNRASIEAAVRIDGGAVHRPAISNYPFATQAIGTPSVETSLRQDVYLTLISAPTSDAGTAVVGVNVQPLVAWLWIGGGVIALGTMLAAVPDRRRRSDRLATRPPASAESIEPFWSPKRINEPVSATKTVQSSEGVAG